MSSRFGRVVATLITVIAATMLVTATPALAHNSLKSSDPKAGSTLDVAPAAVTLTFAEAVMPGKTTVTIEAPDGVSTAAAPKIDGAVVTVPFTATVAGAYVVTYKAVGEDDHPVSSALSFTLTAAAITAATTTAAPVPTSQATTPTTVSAAPAAQTTAAESGFPVWLIVVGGLVVLGAVVGIVAARRRRTG